jgi:protein-S-isoprenylcysteine O-methyltransferase Ste14
MPINIFPLSNFPNSTTATIFTILFIIILLSELRILLRNKTNKHDKGSLPLILIGIFIPLIITISFSFTNLGSLPSTISYLGVILLITGFALRQYSIKILGKYFTPVVQKLKNQKIIQQGPYKYIRHPSYTGLLLELTGTALALSNIISLMITMVLFLPTIFYRIKIEESFLEKHFSEYKNYKKKTKKLIPFIF